MKNKTEARVFTVSMSGKDVTGVTAGKLKRSFHPGYDFEDIEVIEKCFADQREAELKEIIRELKNALKFECDNRCSDLNPCNAKGALATANERLKKLGIT